MVFLDKYGCNLHFASLFQVSTFYSRPRRTTLDGESTRTHYLLPPCSDSDMEVEDDALDDMLDDDDTLDPDILLNLPDDLTPTTSGKQWN